MNFTKYLHQINFSGEIISFSLSYYKKQKSIKIIHKGLMWNDSNVSFLYNSSKNDFLDIDVFNQEDVDELKIYLKEFLAFSIKNLSFQTNKIQIDRDYYFLDNLNDYGGKLQLNFHNPNSNELWFEYALLAYYEVKTMSEALLLLKSDVGYILKFGGIKKIITSHFEYIEDYIVVMKETTDFYGFIDNEFAPEPQLISTFSTSTFLDVLIEFETFSMKIYGEN